MIDGVGDPNAGSYAISLRWLFAAVYPIKRMAKERMGRHFVEPPLEALYWADDPADLTAWRKDILKWRLMIPAPDWATGEMVSEAAREAAKRLGEIPAGLRLGHFKEGLCVQILHLGDPATVRETCTRCHEGFLPSHDLVPNGPHHEIYLKDPNRTAPEKMKIVVRQPVKWR